VATWAAEKVDVGLGLSILQPLVLGPAVVPLVTDPAVAERELELTILSAMAHGNGPNGRAAVEAALLALAHLDREHATVYFQIIYNALREPMRRAVEALIMERQTETKATFPPFIQRLIDEGELKGEIKGEIKGKIEGKIEGKREALLRLLARAGLELTEDDRVRVQACADSATLDRWIDNVFGAKTPTDVLT
jgi:hypothetical protein